MQNIDRLSFGADSMSTVKRSFRGSQHLAVSVTQLSIRNTMVVCSAVLPCVFTQTDLTSQLTGFLIPPWSLWSFDDITLHKWCVMIDQTGKLHVVLIVQATYVTDRLGDEITLTEIFHEVGVVYRSILTVLYLLAWQT